jgi:hypothetical protein
MNGFVSHYVYDANGERTIKLSSENIGVFVNGKFAGDTSAITTFSLYASPYFSMRNSNGVYTKHIYIGSQRIISQVENEKCFSRPSDIPERVVAPTCITAGCGSSITYDERRKQLNKRINHDYEAFDLPYELIKDNSFETPLGYSYPKAVDPFTSSLTVKEVLPAIRHSY